MSKPYEPETLSRPDIDAMRGPVVLDFGANWCGYCQAARPIIEAAMASHPQLPHLKIEDGKGRRLGRSFQVKLWPTLIFMRDGEEVARVVRPTEANEVEDGLVRIQLQ